ncbi:MAG TPA: hypothetical protein ENK70_07715 [Methylophaga sp.]|nr:hypothetical protein [Methylophaga sp.]
MIEFNAYAYFDTRTANYDIPFFCRNDIQAKRKFQLDVLQNKGESVLGTFTKDFDLYCIGIYRPDCGEITQCMNLTISGLDLINILDKPIEN